MYQSFLALDLYQKNDLLADVYGNDLQIQEDGTIFAKNLTLNQELNVGNINASVLKQYQQ
jgi:hypothetical protein